MSELVADIKRERRRDKTINSIIKRDQPKPRRSKYQSWRKFVDFILLVVAVKGTQEHSNNIAGVT